MSRADSFDPNVVDVYGFVSRKDFISVLRQLLPLNISTAMDCIQFWGAKNSEILHAFITCSTAEAGSQLLTLTNRLPSYHVWGACLVQNYLDGPIYYLPEDLSPPQKPWSIFRVLPSSTNIPSRGDVTNVATYLGAAIREACNFSVINVWGFSDRRELEQGLRLKITDRCPIVCVQIWRAKTSEALHAYITLLTPNQGRWAQSALDGFRHSHAWTARPLLNSLAEQASYYLPIKARETNTASPPPSATTESAVPLNIKLSFAPNALIIPSHTELPPFRPHNAISSLPSPPPSPPRTPPVPRSPPRPAASPIKSVSPVKSASPSSSDASSYYEYDVERLLGSFAKLHVFNEEDEDDEILLKDSSFKLL